METRIVNRGTSRMIREACPSDSAGVLYQKCQEHSLISLPANTVISTKRGTGSIKVSEYPKFVNNLPNWGFIVTSRGTATRRN